MSDTTSRNPTGAPRLIADALLRSVGGAAAQFRIAPAAADAAMSELGLVPSASAEIVLTPVVLRKLRPSWNRSDALQLELLVSATSVQQQIRALSLESAQALFAMTLAVTVAGQDYLIESIASSEAFGQIYLYRLLLREARQQAV